MRQLGRVRELDLSGGRHANSGVVSGDGIAGEVRGDGEAVTVVV
jgi:hypothetical protein